MGDALGPGAKRDPVNTEEASRAELQQAAANLDIGGRSSMTKDELADAVETAQGDDEEGDDE